MARVKPVRTSLMARFITGRRGVESRREFAARLGVTRQALEAWEKGTATPTPAHLVHIAEVLGVDLAQLVKLAAGIESEEEAA